MTVGTIRYQRFGTTLVLACGKRDATNEEWTTWCDVYSRAVVEHGVRRLLVVTAGGGPNARQRKEIVAALVRRAGPAVEDISTAACGNSPAVRIVTAAFGWLVGAPRMRSFRADERERALDYLKVPVEQHAEILAGARRLEAELAGAASGITQNDAQ